MGAVPKKKSLFGSALGPANTVKPTIATGAPKAVQAARTVPGVQNTDEVMELSSDESDDQNDPGSIRLSKEELQALIERRKNACQRPLRSIAGQDYCTN